VEKKQRISLRFVLHTSNMLLIRISLCFIKVTYLNITVLKEELFSFNRLIIDYKEELETSNFILVISKI
jgi:hypothetical protein